MSLSCLKLGMKWWGGRPAPGKGKGRPGKVEEKGCINPGKDGGGGGPAPEGGLALGGEVSPFRGKVILGNSPWGKGKGRGPHHQQVVSIDDKVIYHHCCQFKVLFSLAGSSSGRCWVW